MIGQVQSPCHNMVLLHANRYTVVQYFVHRRRIHLTCHISYTFLKTHLSNVENIDAGVYNDEQDESASEHENGEYFDDADQMHGVAQSIPEKLKTTTRSIDAPCSEHDALVSLSSILHILCLLFYISATDSFNFHESFCIRLGKMSYYMHC